MGFGDLLSLKAYLPVGKLGITIDDGWDQLNRVVMFSLFALCGFVVTARSFMGSIIKCIGFSKFPNAFHEDYCWTQGLYTLRHAYDVESSLYPGIIPEEITCQPYKLLDGTIHKCPPASEILPPERVYHLWYQWVPLFFCFGCCVYYAPYIFFKNIGMAEVKKAVKVMKNFVEDESQMEKSTEKVASWLSMTFKTMIDPHNCCGRITQRSKLAFGIIFTKVLYLAASISFFLFTASMFEIGDYKHYGTDWAASFNNDTVTTGIYDKLFPKMVACEIKAWGPTGLIEEQGMCVIAPNVVNQYLFLLVWYFQVGIIVTNTISLLLSPLNLYFPLLGYRKLRVSALIPNNPSMKSLYYNVGSSGRVILNILAENTKPKAFEKTMDILISKLKKDKESAIEGGLLEAIDDSDL